MKATGLLEEQHRRVEAAFEKLAAGDPDPQPILEQLADELTAHLVVEERLFYPAVRPLDEIFDSFEEHVLAALALARLLACHPRDPRFQTHLIALKALVDHHVAEEETALFPKVDHTMDEQAHEELGARLKTLFDEQVARGYATVLPHAPAPAPHHKDGEPAPKSGRTRKNTRSAA